MIGTKLTAVYITVKKGYTQLRTVKVHSVIKPRI